MVKLTVGADPEFGILKDGKRFRNAYDFIPSDEHLKEFGCDGYSAIAEIRPPPAHDPLRFVDNIRTVLRRGAQRGWIPLNNEWRAGSIVWRRPVGGHIHFGVSAKNQIASKIAELIKSLDTHLAHTLALIENPERARFRRSRFGGLGDWRQQPHGFEYRTPASWLVSPEISAGVLSLSFVIMKGTLSGKLNNGQALNQSKFHAHDYDYLRDIHEEAKKEIVKLAGYRRYQPYIDYIYSLIRRRQTWNDDADIRQTWGFISRFEGLKSYVFEDPEEVFELRRVPLSPAGYANFSLNLDFNWTDIKLPEIHHELFNLIEVRDNGLLLMLNEPKLHFYGLRDEDDRPQIKINGRIPRARKLGSFLRNRGYAVEVVRKSEHRGIGLKADLRQDVQETAKLVLFCALSASGLTRLGRRERVIEYKLRGD